MSLFTIRLIIVYESFVPFIEIGILLVLGIYSIDFSYETFANSELTVNHTGTIVYLKAFDFQFKLSESVV